MTWHVEIIDNPTAMGSLRSTWDGLVMKSAGSILGHDPTAGYIWFESLLAAFPDVSATKLVVVRDGNAIVALLPVCLAGKRSTCRQLVVPTIFYGGRNGFLLDKADVELVSALLGGVRAAFGPWQSLRLRVVVESDSDRLLARVSAHDGYRVAVDASAKSPYFPLQDDAETFDSKVAKGLKQSLRTATNKVRALGALTYQEVVDESDAEAAIEAILAVDRNSWKHDAGTAITRHPSQERFYRSLFPRALRANLLYGQILCLAGKPIAFNFGLLQAEIFSCLKHSQTIEYQSLSPSQLLNASMIAKLRAKGVKTYDFMGRPEPHKLRWSDSNQLYECREVRILQSDNRWTDRIQHASHQADDQRDAAIVPEIIEESRLN